MSRRHDGVIRFRYRVVGLGIGLHFKDLSCSLDFSESKVSRLGMRFHKKAVMGRQILFMVCLKTKTSIQIREGQHSCQPVERTSQSGGLVQTTALRICHVGLGSCGLERSGLLFWSVGYLVWSVLPATMSSTKTPQLRKLPLLWTDAARIKPIAAPTSNSKPGEPST